MKEYIQTIKRLAINSFYNLTVEYQKEALFRTVNNCEDCGKIFLYSLEKIKEAKNKLHTLEFLKDVELEVARNPIKFLEGIHEEMHLFRLENN